MINASQVAYVRLSTIKVEECVIGLIRRTPLPNRFGEDIPSIEDAARNNACNSVELMWICICVLYNLHARYCSQQLFSPFVNNTYRYTQTSQIIVSTQY